MENKHAERRIAGRDGAHNVLWICTCGDIENDNLQASCNYNINQLTPSQIQFTFEKFRIGFPIVRAAFGQQWSSSHLLWTFRQPFDGLAPSEGTLVMIRSAQWLSIMMCIRINKIPGGTHRGMVCIVRASLQKTTDTQRGKGTEPASTGMIKPIVPGLGALFSDKINITRAPDPRRQFLSNSWWT